MLTHVPAGRRRGRAAEGGLRHRPKAGPGGGPQPGPPAGCGPSSRHRRGRGAVAARCLPGRRPSGGDVSLVLPADNRCGNIVGSACSDGRGGLVSVDAPHLSPAARVPGCWWSATSAPWLGRPSSCRYVPTCSTYTIEAIEAHGAVKGIWFGARRLARCHPWGGHGWDPVPAPSDRRSPRQTP